MAVGDFESLSVARPEGTLFEFERVTVNTSAIAPAVSGVARLASRECLSAVVALPSRLHQVGSWSRHSSISARLVREVDPLGSLAFRLSRAPCGLRAEAEQQCFGPFSSVTLRLLLW